MSDVPTLTLCRWLNACTVVLVLVIAAMLYGAWSIVFRDSWVPLACATLMLFPVRWVGDRIDAELRHRVSLHREGLL